MEIIHCSGKNNLFMSAYYDLYETPSPNGSEEKKSLHARICPKETYTQKEFVEHVAMFQHLPKNIIGGTGRLHRRTVRPACQRQHCRTRRVGIFQHFIEMHSGYR